jgi:hypothetical protein
MPDCKEKATLQALEEMLNRPSRTGKPVDCRNHTLREMAHIIRNGVPFDQSPESRGRLADWLIELEQSRDAIYHARVALAKTPI